MLKVRRWNNVTISTLIQFAKSTHNSTLIQRLQNDLNSPMLKVKTVKQRHDFNGETTSWFRGETTSQYQRWSNLQNRNIIQRWFNHGTWRWFTGESTLKCRLGIKAPSANAINYVNRKNYHFINVQIVCDASCNILNVVARWPGGSHDSFILQNSYIGQRLQAGGGEEGWLLGE